MSNFTSWRPRFAPLRLLLMALLVVTALRAWPARIFFEAETMQSDGKSWQIRDHFDYWYVGAPSGGKMLSGGGAENTTLGTAVKTVTVPAPGAYHLWVRYVDIGYYRGPFKVTIRQNGQAAGEKIFDSASLRATEEGAKKWGAGYGRFVWDQLAVTLAAGPAEIVLAKSDPISVTSITRLPDCFVLTDEAAYAPNVKEFFPPLYLKVRMSPRQQTPCTVHLTGILPRDPYNIGHYNIYKSGMIAQAYTGYDAKAGNANFFTAGSESPWINIASLLDIMGRNAVQLYAMQEYPKPLPAAEFSIVLSRTPSDEGIFKSFSRSGSGGGLLLVVDPLYADQARSDAEWSFANMKAARALPSAPGKRPATFPLITGCGIDTAFYQPATLENEIAAMSGLGMSGIGSYDDTFFRKGFRRFIPTPSFFYLTNNGCLNDPKIAAIRESILATAKPLVDKGVAGYAITWMLVDEPGSVPLEHLASCAKCADAFRSYLQQRGLTPAAFGKADWTEITPVPDGKASPELYYYTALFRNQTLANFFSLASSILHEVVPGANTSANMSEELTFTGKGLEKGVDAFLFPENALNFGWTEDWLAYSGTFQLCGYRADFLRAAYRTRGFGMYCILRQPWDIKAKAVAEIGHGARALYFYNYGPDYAGGSDGLSRDYSLYLPMQQVNFAVGKVEDYLAGARVPPAKIGLLYSHTTDIWSLDYDHVNSSRESIGLYLLLRHLGYPVDFVTEDDIRNGRLQPYRMLFVTGSHLRRDAVQPLVDWARGGGRLYCGAGSLLSDEFNRPLQLDAQLGIAREPYRYLENAGRELYETPLLKVQETVDFRGKTLEDVCGMQKCALPADARTLAAFADHAPALFTRPLGKGQLVYCGFFPGIAYMKSGVLEKKARDARMEKEHLTPPSYNPPSFAEGYRALLAAAMDGLGIVPVASTSHYLVEANALEGKKGLVIALSNWSGTRLQKVRVTVRTTRKIGKPSAVISGIHAVESKPGQVTVTLDLEAADFLVLPYLK